MKNLFLLFLTMIFTYNISNAQLKEGYVKMEIVDVIVESPEMAQVVGMMKGSTNEIYFSKDVQRVDMNMMSGMVKMTTISHLNSGKVNMFYDMMGNKIEMETSQAESEGEMEDYEYNVEYVKGETKNILGYECKKALVSVSTDQGDISIRMFITDDIDSGQSVVQNVKSGVIKGFPLEVETEVAGMKIIMRAVDIKKSIEKNVFDRPAGEYKKMTMDEFTKMAGGLGGF